MRKFLAILAALLIAAPAYASGFDDWGAIVVAGDWHAHDGSPSEAFDNARRDVSAALARIGFNSGNIEQFSVRPERYPDQRLMRSDPLVIGNALWDLSNRANGGCLIYFSSHGSGEGVVVADKTLAPDDLAILIGNDCGNAPTVVIISACFSGVFVPALAAPNRFIMTAARPDRSSFGCGSDNKYPYFDTCFLQSIAATHNFPDLAIATKKCVAELERKTGMSPPSQPQISIGADVAAKLPSW
ncbi:MAG TPA: C13 family peptidase [Rhizomicrobium sp.]|jgi:hypothetical protein|nr:C13 family peptidase [Rhizomicrobium sp.]